MGPEIAERAIPETGVIMKLKLLASCLAYFDGDDVPASSNAWGSWKSANIRYFVY